MINKRKAWFFGDSFTYGNRFKLLEIEYPKWPLIICDEFDWMCLNFGEGGIGTQEIINNLIIKMGGIAKNDIVFISDTNPIRHLDVVKHDDEYTIGTVNTDLIHYNPSGFNKIKDYISQYIDIKTATTYVDYILNFRSNHSLLWETYYRDIIFALKKELNRRDIEVYYWSSQLWRTKNMFTDISYESNNAVLDMHWGPNGHYNMAQYMINRIKDKKYIVESEFMDVNY